MTTDTHDALMNVRFLVDVQYRGFPSQWQSILSVLETEKWGDLLSRLREMAVCVEHIKSRKAEPENEKGMAAGGKIQIALNTAAQLLLYNYLITSLCAIKHCGE